MISLYHGGIISPLPIDQLESYMISYGFRMTEHYDDLCIMKRDPIPLILVNDPLHVNLHWNLDHYPLTHEGTKQLENDLSLWGISKHNRMVLLLTHQERYGPVIGYYWTETTPIPFS